MNKLIGLIGLFLIGCNVANGQGKPQLGIVIQDLGAHAAQCGISKSSIESIAATTLRNSGIQAMGAAVTNPFLYVSSTILFFDGRGCVADVAVSMRRAAPSAQPLDGFKPKGGVATLLLCESGNMLSGTAAELLGRITGALETSIKHCLGQVDY